MNSKLATAIIEKYFPNFNYKRVYNECRASGHVIRYYNATGFDERVLSWELLRSDICEQLPVMSIRVEYNNCGGRTIELSVKE